MNSWLLVGVYGAFTGVSLAIIDRLFDKVREVVLPRPTNDDLIVAGLLGFVVRNKINGEEITPPEALANSNV